MSTLPPEVLVWMPAVMQGLVASTLYSVLGQLYSFGRLHVFGNVDVKVQKAIASSGLESVVGTGPLAEGAAEELKCFLSSAEAQIVVR